MTPARVGWVAKATASASAATFALRDAQVGAASPDVSQPIRVPAGATLGRAQTSIHQTAKVNERREARLEIDWQRLTLHRPSGAPVELDLPRRGALEAIHADFAQHASPENAPPDVKLLWNSTRTYGGAGTAGQLFSVARQQHTTDAWFGRKGTTELATYDARTGERVTLDALLSPAQMTRLINTLTTAFNRGAELDVNQMTAAQVRALVNTQFAVNRAANGATTLDFAWETNRFNGPSGSFARFSVEAPADAAFRTKVGLPSQ